MIQVQNASAESIDALMNIAVEAGLSKWSRPDYLAELRRVDSIFLTATDNFGAILGFIVGRIVPGSGADSQSAEIYNIAVGRQIRRSGVGTKIFATFLTEAAKRGADQVFLEVRAANFPAIKFYEKLGFVIEYRRPAFYTDPVEDATVMRAIISTDASKKLEREFDLQ